MSIKIIVESLSKLEKGKHTSSKSLMEQFDELDKKTPCVKSSARVSKKSKFIESLKRCIRRLNEAEMSDEDKKDTEILKRIYNKTQERSNSKLTPEEKDILAKYGLTRVSDFKSIKLDDADEWGEEAELFRDSDNETSRYRDYYGKTQRSVKPGAQKINYADRARKMHDRKYARDLRRGEATNAWDLERSGTPTSAFKKPLDDMDPKYKGRFIDKERAALDLGKGKKVRSMKWALDDRKRARKNLDTIDSTYDAKVKDIKDRYEKELADTEAGREISRGYSQSSFDRSQERIDDLLGKKKVTESEESKILKEAPVYDMTPQYDARKSFYGKARVDVNGDEKTLYSYNTPVARISDGKVELLPRWDESQTTLRHVKEFLKQNGFEAGSLAQLRKTYL